MLPNHIDLDVESDLGGAEMMPPSASHRAAFHASPCDNLRMKCGAANAALDGLFAAKVSRCRLKPSRTA